MKSRNYRFHVWTQSLFLAWIPLLAGCAGPSDGPSAFSSDLQPTPSQPARGEIDVWSWNIAAKALNKIAPDFERKNPGIKVKVNMTGARLESRLLLSLASGVGAPDVSQL